MTEKPWTGALRAAASSVPLLIAERYARVSRICRQAAEREDHATIDEGRAPCDPIEYLAENEEAFLEAAVKAVDAGRLDLAAEIVRNVGVLYDVRSQLTGRFQERWDDILRIVSNAAAGGADDTAYGLALVLLARRERVQNDWESARIKAAEAVAWCVARSSGDRSVLLLQADAHEILGEVHRSHGSPDDLDVAVSEFRCGLRCAAEAEAQPFERRQAEVKLRDRLGYALFLRGDHAAAAKELGNSIRLHGTTPDRSELSRSLNNLGKVLAARNHRHAARRCFECSLRLKRDKGDKRGEAVCHQEIGLLYRADGKMTLAVEHLVASLRIKRQIGDKHGIGLSCMELGFTLEALGDARGVAYLEEALLFLTPQSVQHARVRDHLAARKEQHEHGAFTGRAEVGSLTTR
jgi:tetratricopeptide (TPR) repeat protein